MNTMHPRRRWAIAAGALSVALIAGGLVYANRPAASPARNETAATCRAMPEDGPMAPPGEPKDTTVATVGEAYWCILANYFSGPTLDDRSLLLAGFQAFTQGLLRRGVDRPNAVMPALTGDRESDWAAMSRRYEEVLATLPADAAVRSELMVAAIQGMIDGLHDDHARLENLAGPAGPGQGLMYALGVHTLPTGGSNPRVTATMVAPLYVDLVLPGSPAAAAGLLPGDVIVAVNDIAPFVNGKAAPGVIAWLYPTYPSADPVRVTVQRPATGKTWTVTLNPGGFPMPQPAALGKRRIGDVGYVSFSGFSPGVAEQVIQAIADLRKESTLTGLVVDVRGNRGGSPDEVGKLLSALVHDKVWMSLCDAYDHCTPSRTDTTTPLLNLPLVVLIDGDCASACDGFTSNVKDLGLGRLVGSRTAGVASGPGTGYLLGDNQTVVGMPKLHVLGANGEIFGGIGTPPDFDAPITAADLSAGKDPGLAKALELLAK